MNNPQVVIIGGGITGTAIAYHLAKLGAKQVTVLEKDYLSSGSTGRCGGGIRQQWSSPYNVRLAMKSVEHFTRFREEMDMDIEYYQGGYLLLSFDEEEATQFEENVRMQREEGLKVDILSSKEVSQKYPYIRTEGLKMATFCKTDGHANPHKATFGYANAAKKLGVSIHTHTLAKQVDVQSGAVKGVHTTRGYFPADIVINAAGPWSKEVGQLAGIDLPTESFRHQIFVTEALDYFFPFMAISFSGNFYIRQALHGQFIMGKGDADEVPGINRNVTYRFAKEMAIKMVKVFPFLENLRILRHWSGEYNMSPDAQPVIGESPHIKGFYYSVGYSGHGFMIAPAVAEGLAHMIMNGSSPYLDLAPLNIHRFSGKTQREKNVV